MIQAKVFLFTVCFVSSVICRSYPEYPTPAPVYPTQAPVYPTPAPVYPTPAPRYPWPPTPQQYPAPAPVQDYNPDIGQTNVGGTCQQDPYCHKVEEVVFENQCEPYTEKTCWTQNENTA
eukprot:TRINITY_DN3143_c0_g1_i2.p2 TRINITY_DN3143_c0_g1~~TRINITY_DN3143_c0_g1_i2.p2  ORF type:complete len:119 (-),score=24.95 TRINITY_DN3143_c0_g1_i2:29-385(-)